MPIGKPLLDALDRMGYGGLLLDSADQVTRINATAVQLLGGHGETDGTDNDLAWSRQALQRLLGTQTINGFNFDADEWVTVPQDQEHASWPMIVRTIPFDEGGVDGPKQVMMLIDLRLVPRPSAEVLKKVFRLTPSEARLAIEMSSGKCPEDVADLCQVSVSTIRKQLATVFAKTNTHRQSELVALLARLSILP